MHCVPIIFQFLSICKKGSSAPVSAVAGLLLILAILLVILLLLYCFNHEERLISLFQRYVIQGCFERQKTTFRMKGNFKEMAAWLTKLKRYRDEAEPKGKTITIRFENLSLVLKKVKLFKEVGEGSVRPCQSISQSINQSINNFINVSIQSSRR